MRKLLFSLTLLLLVPSASIAAPQQTYQQGLAMAVAGHDSEAIAYLKGAATLLPADDVWRERMELTARLLDMRRQQSVALIRPKHPSAHARLAEGYLSGHAGPEAKDSWMPGLLAAIIPGAGHAWQGRLRDAMIAVVLVFPMLILTFWAASRRMGPVTVFFALLTVWLWSGTVFSAVSLAERGDFAAYQIWWQGLWQASGLPGRPW